MVSLSPWGFQINRVVDAAAIFKDKDAGLFHKQRRLFAEEKVGLQDCFAFCQFGLGGIKVELDAGAIDEFDRR